MSVRSRSSSLSDSRSASGTFSTPSSSSSHRLSSFTRKLYGHGFYADNSMHRQSQCHRRKVEAERLRPLKLSHTNFSIDEDIEYILKMKAKIASSQNMIVSEIRLREAIIRVQCWFRVLRSQRMLRVLRYSRYGIQRWHFFVYFRKRVYSCRKIALFYKSYQARIQLLRILKWFCSALRLQRAWKALKLRNLGKRYVACVKLSRKQVPHCILFGLRRAVVKIENLYRLSLAQKELGRKLLKLWKLRFRRKRIERLQGAEAKMIFYQLLEYCPDLESLPTEQEPKLLSTALISNISNSNLITAVSSRKGRPTMLKGVSFESKPIAIPAAIATNTVTTSNSIIEHIRGRIKFEEAERLRITAQILSSIPSRRQSSSGRKSFRVDSLQSNPPIVAQSPLLRENITLKFKFIENPFGIPPTTAATTIFDRESGALSISIPSTPKSNSPVRDVCSSPPKETSGKLSPMQSPAQSTPTTPRGKTKPRQAFKYIPLIPARSVTVFDIVWLIVDITKAALETPSLVDGEVPRQLLNLNFSNSLTSTPRANVKFLRTNKRKPFNRAIQKQPHSPSIDSHESHSPTQNRLQVVKEKLENDVLPNINSARAEPKLKQPAHAGVTKTSKSFIPKPPVTNKLRSNQGSLAAPNTAAPAVSRTGKFVTSRIMKVPIPPKAIKPSHARMINPMRTSVEASISNVSHEIKAHEIKVDPPNLVHEDTGVLKTEVLSSDPESLPTSPTCTPVVPLDNIESPLPGTAPLILDELAIFQRDVLAFKPIYSDTSSESSVDSLDSCDSTVNSPESSKDKKRNFSSSSARYHLRDSIENSPESTKDRKSISSASSRHHHHHNRKHRNSSGSTPRTSNANSSLGGLTLEALALGMN